MILSAYLWLNEASLIKPWQTLFLIFHPRGSVNKVLI